MAETVKIGWAEVDFTPNQRVKLCGQFAERISEYVETPVTATALALDAGEQQAIMVSTDLVAADLNLLLAVREAIKPQIPDFDPEMLMISAIHTHTSIQFTASNLPDAGGSLSVLRKYKPAEVTYVDNAPADPDVMTDDEALVYLTGKIAEAAVLAWKSRKAGMYANEFGRAAVGMCRRAVYDDGTAAMWGDTDTPNFDHLESGNDSGLELIYFFDEAGKLTGVLANLACPAQAVQHRKFISSDFWGKAKILMRKELGEDVYLLPLCAPAGCQCPVDLIRWVEPDSDLEDPNIVRVNPKKRKADPSMFDIQGSWKAGRRIAHEIIDCFEEAKEEMRPLKCLVHKNEKMILPLRQVTITEKKEAEKALKEFFRDRKSDTINFYDSAAMHVYAGTIERYEYQQKHQTFTIEAHCMKLDDIAFATNPFELFLDYGNKIRAMSPAEQTILVQLCNGSFGYLPTIRAERGGHYSAYVSSGTTGHEGGDLYVRETLATLKEMFGE